MMSCLIRNDYNIIFAYFIIILLNSCYRTNTKLFTKVIIHILFVITLADTCWIALMFNFWSHDEGETYWNRFSGIHSLAKLLAVVELVIKLLVIVYMAFDYKRNKNELKGLFSFNYSDKDSEQSMYLLSLGVVQNERANPDMSSGEFRNPFK
jgi:hypothetical protein